ncbi:hypothetical protein EXIGLDRAFT_608940 [Exidia glandulosa HHB12029]|uniref:LysM domain-containing protein n=1 Tax=Exidia glandulosa HHB12029 TaxID=1314781 RepID=A0A165KP17_EXIGL|nr:hypothetical protein EXIGLDRAFT_608940 [Exidia glandulosa HHB12029]
MAQRQQLCLSCSSSPTPKGDIKPFVTSCCSRPICAACLERSPRLREYSPCLACLAGVSAVSRAASGTVYSTPRTEQRKREESMFVLGDSDEEESDNNTPPAYDAADSAGAPSGDATLNAAAPSENITRSAHSSTPSGPPLYYVRRGDTLQGIAFKFGVDGRELCTLNNLPSSTMSTTPHLLHTRRTLTLPPHARNLDSLPPPPSAEEQARQQRERAEKRFQFVTKEVDWRIARTYVALAEDDDDETDLNLGYEDKKALVRQRHQPLEGKAVDQYLDDEEWERSTGSTAASIPRFPVKA